MGKHLGTERRSRGRKLCCDFCLGCLVCANSVQVYFDSSGVDLGATLQMSRSCRLMLQFFLLDYGSVNLGLLAENGLRFCLQENIVGQFGSHGGSNNLNLSPTLPSPSFEGGWAIYNHGERGNAATCVQVQAITLC